MIQLIGIMLGFYVGMQAAVAFETGREKNSTGLQILAAVTMLVAMVASVGILIS